uniref:Protein kinase domain-containing protein n=1 Tax=Tetradesmus obliquus TaxID=3088 RepID=A0A383W883_TETOB|eukprot:jgi/Sobl393_1/8855/SZX73329.1
MHVWLLTNNISLDSLGEPGCWRQRRVNFTTQIFSQEINSSGADAHRLLLELIPPSSNAAAHSGAASAVAYNATPKLLQGNDVSNASAPEVLLAPRGILHSLSFAFLRDAFVLPATASDQFLQIQNVTLTQLPQGPNAREAADAAAGPWPADLWTVLLWSIDRPRHDSPVTLGGVRLLLPQPEFDYLEAAAKAASSFVVDLQGVPTGITFSGATVGTNAVRVAAMQAPGLSATNIWLLPDPAAADGMPDRHAWPLALTAARRTGSTSSSSAASGGTSHQAAVRAAIGASVGAVVALALLLGAAWLWHGKRRRGRQQQQPGNVYDLAATPAGASSMHLHRMQAGGDGLAGLPAGTDVSCGFDQAADQEPKQHCQICAERLPADPPRCSNDSERAAVASSAAGALAARRASRDHLYSNSSGQLAGSHLLSRNSDCSTSLGGTVESTVEGTVESESLDVTGDSVSTGLERWRAAISLTTMQMMERRMQQSLHTTPPSSASGSSQQQQQQQQQQYPACAAAAAGAHGGAAAAAAGSRKQSDGQGPGVVLGAAGASAVGRSNSSSVESAVPAQQPLRLQTMIGQGSFGSVYLGTWHGRRVAVKVMQLPANALLGQPQPRSNSAPHMAIMETVVSSTISHPNLVQVYTYTLNPLIAGEEQGSGSGSSRRNLPPLPSQARQQQQQQQAPPHGANTSAGSGQQRSQGIVSGWELRLVMEYCDQGTLRDVLDNGMLLRGRGSSSSSRCMHPGLALGLAQDTAAALLHLHAEGVVHGDLKAANVLLTRGGEDCGGLWASCLGYRVTAKVADFGLALQLDASDTHATMAARGTPTHMSPELFLSGHVSKASDVYAFGILLFEMLTGQRAYAGVPIPLLPHEVARQGLRPAWPANLPPGCRDLQRLAEACWAQQPQDRPCLQEVFEQLASCSVAPQERTQGSPVLLHPQRHSLDNHSGSFVQSVQQQLHELQVTAEQQVMLVQQGQVQQALKPRQAVAGQPLAAAFDLSWSEGTPTHMSPELFLSGHVSKASDVYAFGILLFEMLTGQRAYAGVPIPLLPHEVARQGLRPAWPANLPPGCRDLQRLAEACWAQQPQDRPCLQEVFEQLASCSVAPQERTQGSPVLLHPQRHSLDNHSGSFVQSVQQQLHELQVTAEQQVMLVQQGQVQQALKPRQAVAGQPLAAAFDLSWSEVTHGAIKLKF